MSDALQYIGSRIRMLREQQGLTIEELAKISNITKSYLAQMERGEANFSINKLADVCSSLHIQLSDIFEKNDKLVTNIHASAHKEQILTILDYLLKTDHDRDVSLVLGLIKAMRK